MPLINLSKTFIDLKETKKHLTMCYKIISRNYLWVVYLPDCFESGRAYRKKKIYINYIDNINGIISFIII